MKITVLFSPTCVPCKLLDTKVRDILKDHPEIEYSHLNALEHPEYNVLGTPHVIIEKDGVETYNKHPSNIGEAIKVIKDNL